MFEKLGRAILESPFAASRVSEEMPELAEIRLAVLDAIKSKSHRVAGKMVFPFNLIRIHLLGIPEKQAETFQSDFLSTYFHRELREGLDRSSYRYPDDLQVEITTTPELPGPRHAWIRTEAEMVSRPHAEITARAPREGILFLANGAEQTHIPLTKPRTNIGRTEQVYKESGPSRRNDIFFASDTETNRSVSREHAHILLDRSTGEYRLFNDRWYALGASAEANCGLWIVRDGMSQPVHRNSRGVALEDGDEIHFGRAVAKFALKPADSF